MNATNDVAEHMSDMSDSELLEAGRTALDDLATAAIDEPGSDWHQSCFAAVLIYAEEIQARHLTLATIH